MTFDLITDSAHAVVKITSKIIIEVVFELFIQGVGFLICRPFSKQIKMESGITTGIGLAFWMIIFFSAFKLNAALEVDSCLDSGGKFDYDARNCVFTEDDLN